MVHITELHLNVLQRIVADFYDALKEEEHIDDFKLQLPLVAVCRVWRELALPYVYSMAHLRCRDRIAGKDSKTAQPHYKWESNIGLFTALHKTVSARKLKIELTTTEHGWHDLTRALDSCGFSTAPWPKVAHLEIYDVIQNRPNRGSAPGSKSDDMLATQLAEYFSQHISNVMHLYLSLKDTPTCQFISKKLSNLYLGQLRSLHCANFPVSFDRRSFSPCLASLRIWMGSEVAHTLPKMLASSLRVLALSNIPPNFSWGSFVTDICGHITFANLRELVLEFDLSSRNIQQPKGASEQEEVGSVMFDTNHRHLHFPKLESLVLCDSPYEDGTLYSTFVHSPLQSVEIFGSPNSVLPMDTRLLLNAPYILFSISFTMSYSYEFAQLFQMLLSSSSAAKTAALWVHGYEQPISVPDQINWIDLEQLTIGGSLHLSSAIKVVAQLRKLSELFIENILNDVYEDSINLQTTLREDPRDALPINTGLRLLQIAGHSNEVTATSVRVICHLILATRSLATLEVSGTLVLGVKGLIASYMDAFPHLRNIQVESYW